MSPLNDDKRRELYDLAVLEGIDPETLYAAWLDGDPEVEAEGEVTALRARAEKAEAERDKLSAELRDARVIAEEAAGLRVALDEARARVEAIAVERNTIVSELSQTADALVVARAERDEARARPTYEARTVAPTIAEWRGHFRAGGSWIVLRPQWVPLVTILRGAYLSGAYLSGAARYTDDAIIPGWTLRDGRLVREVSP